MAEFDENVQCGNCGLCRIDSTDYFGRCSNCGERDWELIKEDKWLSVPELEEMAESTGQDTEQLKKDKEAFLEMSRSDTDTDTDDEAYTDPGESGLRSAKGPALLSRLFGKF